MQHIEFRLAVPPSAEEIQKAELVMRVEHLPIESLKLPDRRVRQHGDKEMHMLKKSVKAFGIVKSPLIDSNNVLITGSAVWWAAKALGYKTVPTIRIEHLSPPLVRMYRFKDNQSSVLGENDPKLLRDELEDLSNFSIELNLALEPRRRQRHRRGCRR